MLFPWRKKNSRHSDRGNERIKVGEAGTESSPHHKIELRNRKILNPADIKQERGIVMEGRISDVFGKGTANLFMVNSFSKTGNVPKKNDPVQTGSIVKNQQDMVTHSPNSELSIDGVAKSQNKGFDQYF